MRFVPKLHRCRRSTVASCAPWAFLNSSTVFDGAAPSLGGEKRMEFYLSFHELLGRGGNSLAIVFLPLFLVMTVLEGLIILYR